MIRFFSITLLISLMFTGADGCAQKKHTILFKIDGQPQLVSGFLNNYNKNSDIVADTTQKNVENYLDLYINFKLKVLEAKSMKLDTLPDFIGELARYKQQLMTPYLKDSLAIEKLVKEAYNRTKYEVNASHILIRVDQYAKPADTLIAYQKI
ncbi:MAG: peptidylprolyl isomerase, partial [Flavobacteriales bacterium CG11_big_fil_rev_8_21_14_0_20_35_7]